jgi:hypothetical protein
MNAKKFKINPVKATCWKYKDRDHGIQGINDTCYGVCASFSKSGDAYNIDERCGQMCKDLVEKRKIEIFGVGSCDHQVPYLPVIWDQTPRYFPDALENSNNPEIALMKCKKMCEKTNLVNQCQEECEVDYHAIETYSSPISSQITSEKNGTIEKQESNGNDKKNDPFSTIILLVVLIPTVIILILLYFLFRRIF